jgi:hypothetical protein
MQVLEMCIPGKGHENIGYDQQDDRSHIQFISANSSRGARSA